MRQTLFSRVFGIYIIVVGVALVILGGIASVALSRYGINQTKDRVEVAASVAAIALGPVLEISDGLPDSVTRSVSGFSVSEITLSLVDPNGTVVHGAGALETEILALVTEAGSGAEARTGTVRVSGIGRIGYAVVSLAPGQPSAASGPETWHLVATRPTALAVNGTNSILILFLAVSGAITVGLAVLLRAALRWIRTPLASIQRAARSYARGELIVQLVPQGPEELVDLARNLNEMATELRRRLAAISKQRNELETTLASMVEGVVVLDIRRAILSMNSAAGRLLNVSPSGASGRTLIDYLRNAQLDELAELAAQSEHPIEQTVTLYRERPLHLQVHASPLRDETGGAFAGTVLVMNDISRLKQLEDLRKDFVANVSHELKTPITSIKGFVETLLDGAVDDPDHSRRFLSIILNHADRLHSIIEDLLSLSRLEQHDQRITFYEFPVRTLLESTIEICGPKAEERSIRVVYELNGDEMAWGNPNLLEQALVNLVDNAIKYSSNGDKVEIAVHSDPEMLTMRVMDHGQGIRRRDLPRIFERFYRTDKARSRELGGTGLGLAIVKHIARAHLGEVSVQSILGEGSTFTIEIPQWRMESEGGAGAREAGLTEWDSYGA